jgi:acylphosphatase
MALAARHCLISGRVQGVGYRYFASRLAAEYQLCGSVRNLPDGGVEVCIQGEEKTLDRMISFLRVGPPGARVDRIQVREVEPSNQVLCFSILR